jgi:hypothetical protein
MLTFAAAILTVVTRFSISPAQTGVWVLSVYVVANRAHTHPFCSVLSYILSVQQVRLFYIDILHQFVVNMTPDEYRHSVG